MPNLTWGLDVHADNCLGLYTFVNFLKIVFHVILKKENQQLSLETDFLFFHKGEQQNTSVYNHPLSLKSNQQKILYCNKAFFLEKVV